MNKQKPLLLSNNANATISVVETKSLIDIKNETGNLYESINVIAKRANQINVTLREELRGRMEEFNFTTDSVEEVRENKEQIELSRMYEKLPNAAILATAEFMTKKVYHRKEDKTNNDLFR